MNYFDFYELPISFSIDENLLKKKYLEQSRKFHPDFFVNEPEKKQSEILQLSTLNTNAFNTLSDFDKRIKYVLEFKKVLTEGEKYDLPQDFLMDMMEVNEELMELEMEGDRQVILEFGTRIADLMKEQYDEVKNILENNSGANFTMENLLSVKEYFFKRKYLLRIQERINKFARF